MDSETGAGGSVTVCGLLLTMCASTMLAKNPSSTPTGPVAVDPGLMVTFSTT